MAWDSNQGYSSSSPRPQPPRRSPSMLVPALALLTLVLAALAIGGAVYFYFRDRTPVHDPNAVPRAVTPRGDLTDLEKSTIEVYNNTRSSVVHITTLVNVSRDSLSLNVQQVPEGTGSGFVWDDEGHIVTNYHVIQKANAAQVSLDDQTTYPAQVWGVYFDKDLAVLKIDAPRKKLPPVPLGTSNDLQVGQKAFAIGNPFGLDQTLTSGIISALGREIESVTRRPIKNVIQTDAPINPGNSGGPLLDSAGLLIGVNTAIYSPSGASAGIGFAIPVDEVNHVVPQLIRSGKVTRPSLGVQLASDQIMQQLDQKGALIMNVVPDSPAAKAGLKPTRKDSQGHLQLGDIIVGVDDTKIESVSDVFSALESHKAGDTVKLHILRDGKPTDVDVTLGTANS